MELSFTPVSRKTSSAVKAPEPGIEKGYGEVLEYFSDEANQSFDLDTTFPTEKARNAFLAYARAQAEVDGYKLRAVVNEKGSARLVFRMESLEKYNERKAHREAATADREARRAAGEVIKPGRKAQS